jgi:hypothetical protein
MMRLRLAAGALTAVLLGAGCSAGGDTGDTTGDGVAPSAAGRAGAGTTAAGPSGAGQNAGDAALVGNTDAICDQAARTGGEFAATFAQDLKLLIDAESARDKAQAARVKAKTSRDVDNYSFALADMSRLAADPALKRALAEMGQQVSVLKGDVRKLDEKKLASLQTTLDDACHK